MEGILYKINNIYALMVNGKMVASNDEDFQIDYAIKKLSLKNCQAIENGYDLDELAEKRFGKSLHHASNRHSFREGFQKALELIGDKKFSEEHIKVAADWYYETKGKKSIDEYIQSLQKTEWDVIVEMECPQCKEWGYISECRNNCNQKFLQPKLDADGCLILKRK